MLQQCFALPASQHQSSSLAFQLFRFCLICFQLKRQANEILPPLLLQSLSNQSRIYLKFMASFLKRECERWFHITMKTLLNSLQPRRSIGSAERNPSIKPIGDNCHSPWVSLSYWRKIPNVQLYWVKVVCLAGLYKPVYLSRASHVIDYSLISHKWSRKGRFWFLYDGCFE